MKTKSLISNLTAIALLTITSLQYLNTPSWPAALMFVISALLFGLIHFLERSKEDELETFKKRIELIENKINGLAIARGMGR